jgi:hypothetical protein
MDRAWGSIFSPTIMGWRVRRSLKENMRSRPCSQSKSRPAQRVGVVRVSVGNANGARGYTAADGKGLEDDERKKRFLCYICMDYVQLS